MRTKAMIVLAALLCGLLMVGSGVWAMSSGSYAINWDVIGGGGEPASSANYAVRGTIGQPAAESAFSTNYGLWSGYWYPAAPAPPPEEPTIDFDPTSFSFFAVEGGANPADKTLEVWNSGGGTLDWSVSDDADWLGLNPPSGSSTGPADVTEVTVSVDISGMSANHYDATITISAPGATNSPQTVPVTLDISMPGPAVTWNLEWGLDVDPAAVNIWTYPGDAVTVTLADVEWSMPDGLLVWHYGGPIEGWRFYKKGWGAVNTLETLVPGKGYIGIVPTASVWEIPQG